jgi:hypothetical protein
MASPIMRRPPPEAAKEQPANASRPSLAEARRFGRYCEIPFSALLAANPFGPPAFGTQNWK